MRSLALRLSPKNVFQFLCFSTVLVLAAVCLVIFYTRPQYTDDAFITFRAARNLAEGKGPYFNVGERVQSSTTPLYLLMQAGGAALTKLPPDRVENALGTFSLALVGVLLFFLGRSVPALKGAACLLPLLYFVQMTDSFRVKGMEVFLYTSLILGTAIAEAKERRLAVGVLIGLTACARTEGGLFALAYLLYWVAGRLIHGPRPYPWRTLGRVALATFLTGLPFLVFVLVSYHSILPSSVQGKMLQTRGWWSTFAGHLEEYLFAGTPHPSLLGGAPLKLPSLWGPLVLLAGAFAFLRVGGSRIGATAWRALCPPLLFVAIYSSLFMLFHAPNYYWYSFPVKVLLIPAIALAFVGLWRWAAGMRPLLPLEDAAAPEEIAEQIPRLSRAWRAPGVALFAAAVLYGALWQATILAHTARLILRDDPKFLNDGGYRAAGDFLRKNAGDSGWTFASVEIGILGYESGLRCLDLAGLVSPECRSFFTREPLSAIVLRFLPELYVTIWFPEFQKDSTEYNPDLERRFLAKYRLVLAEKLYPGREIRIFCRRDLQWPPKNGADAPPPFRAE